MATATQLIIPVGQRCLWRATEKIRVLCEVKDTREVWGRVDLFVVPVEGRGGHHEADTERGLPAQKGVKLQRKSDGNAA